MSKLEAGGQTYWWCFNTLEAENNVYKVFFYGLNSHHRINNYNNFMNFLKNGRIKEKKVVAKYFALCALEY